MSERSNLIAWIRGELVGPSRHLAEPHSVGFDGPVFVDPETQRRGALVWRPAEGDDTQEVLYYERETPHRKYGVGLLHPAGAPHAVFLAPDSAAGEASDTMGVESQEIQGPENDRV